MSLKAEEISWVLQKEIEKYSENIEFESVGRVTQLGDGIDASGHVLLHGALAQDDAGVLDDDSHPFNPPPSLPGTWGG